MMKRVLFILLMVHSQYVVPVRVRVDPSRLERELAKKRKEDAWLNKNVPIVAERLRQFRAQQAALRWWLRRYMGKSFGL